MTICTKDRLCLFGYVGEGRMRLNNAGNKVHQIWEQLPKRFPSITLDGFVVMPDINILDEMADLMIAQRSFEANVTVINAAKSMISKSLEI